ncbi:MAG: hypothetical protein HC836_30435 [Richelia sp. RM2_1_2]|nr:hypothetical protein [Richelia sp. RM2_1_2]
MHKHNNQTVQMHNFLKLLDNLDNTPKHVNIWNEYVNLILDNFITSESKNKCIAVVLGNQPGQFFEVSARLELVLWCCKHCSKKFNWDFIDSFVIRFWFEHEQDALLFKLTWLHND